MNVPKLRFKEFTSNVAIISFGQIVLSNQYGPRFNANDYSIEGNIKTIRGMDISSNGEIKYSQVPIAQLDSCVINGHVLKDGDLVMITTAECGLTGVFEKQEFDYISSAYAVKITLNSTCVPYYFKYFFQTIRAKNEIKSFIRKGTVANLPCSDILKLKVPLPSLLEQTKIANFLSAVDDKIAELTKKVELLQRYKKGVMQQIFSQQLRFKDDNGQDFPEWEESTIGELISVKSAKFDPTRHGNKFKCIELEHLSQDTGILLGYIDAINQKSIKNIFKKDDVLFGKLRPYLRKFLKAPFDGVCSTEIWVLKGKKISNSFLYQFIQTEYFLMLSNISSGSKMPRADWEVIASAEVKFPCLPEQTKIANFLSALDEQINTSQQQLDATKQYKKSLLQQMFI